MTTNSTTRVLDIITLALKDAGIVGQSQVPQNPDANDAFTRLNWMLSQMQRKRWLCYHLIDVAKVSTGAQSYTVGPPGSDFLTNTTDSSRPDKLEDAFFRQINLAGPNQIDYPVEILQSREDYDQIALKQLQAFPSYAFYDAAWGNNHQGIVYFWPLAQANIYELHIVVKVQLLNFTDINQLINLPPEYFAMFHKGLAVQLRDAYGLPPKPLLIGQAKAAFDLVRKANTNVPRLKVPAELLRAGSYNPYSDQIR